MPNFRLRDEEARRLAAFVLAKATKSLIAPAGTATG
jgi:hypothetical protein